MILKRIAAVSLSSATVLAAGSGVAQADNDVYVVKDSQVLNCFNLRIAEVSVLSTGNDNIDCATNVGHVEAPETNAASDAVGR
ncbi:hypothetical protein [Streptomyces sulfonofaciens]|uniref:hypothetical protein n=1 Tax=Streptomyces sulfonofaciens TaxID=68272 RepID=UPI00167A04E7|nr:hypothetical protein [Streptomyces sulfonofaciens]